jgi:hypothetical protein
MTGEEDEEDEEEDEEDAEEDDEDEDDDCLCEGDGWRLRLKPSTACVHVAAGGGGGGPSEAVYVPAAAPAPAPAPRPREYPVLPFQSEPAAAAGPTTPTKAAACGGGGGGAATPAAEWAHAEAKSSGLARRLALLQPLPTMAYPTLEMVENTTHILESVVLGEKAMQYESELKAMIQGYWMGDNGNWRWSLEKAYEGGWTTLPDGRRVMLWAFHAFAPPADGSYRTTQPLVHLGLYNATDRSLDTSEAPPALPRDPAHWPWA